jgi:uncharacterized protein (TIGR02646 family)
MIYVYQDPTKIPKVWLDKVKKLQTKLEALATVAERKKFIDDRPKVWGEIKGKLLEMSHGKCWYSEAPDAVSDWHIDHFRPKGRAKDEDNTAHEGYDWLAFDWKNYRIAGSYGNAPHKDDDAAVRGKWDFFPLGPGSVRASWASRDVAKEICLILDPATKQDSKLLTFDETGRPIPSDPKNPIAKKKVEVTVHYLYLDSERLGAARRKVWRTVLDWIAEYRDCCPEDYASCTPRDFSRFDRHIEKLGELTGPAAHYAATARACLRVNSLGYLIQSPEEARAA